MSPSRSLLTSLALWLCAVTAAAQQPSADPAWDAASALKKKADYVSAAQAFQTWAKANASQPRLGEGLTEAGVCWFSVGRSQLKLLRMTPESKASFDKALGCFDDVLKLGAGPYGARAQHMRGSVKFFSGDMAGAEVEYGRVIDGWKTDAKYVPKALEKRAGVRRNLLHTRGAIEDLTRYTVEFPQGEDIAAVKQYLNYCKKFEKPAPPLVAEAWIQGAPVTLDALKGDVVLVYFFATWCENCEAVRPFLLDVIQRYEPMGIKVIGVVTHSKGQTVDSVRGWLGANKITFPVMMDKAPTAQSESGTTTISYEGGKIPDVALIDRAGRLRWHDNPNNLPDSTIDALLVEDPTQPLNK